MTITLDLARRRRSAPMLVVDREARVIAQTGDVDFETVALRIRELINRHMKRGDDAPDSTIEDLDGTTALRVTDLRGEHGPCFAVTFERAEQRRSAIDAIISEHRLTTREREVFGMLLMGSTDNEISERLTIAPTTAQEHTKNILRKTGTGKRTALLAKVIRYDDRYADVSLG